MGQDHSILPQSRISASLLSSFRTFLRSTILATMLFVGRSAHAFTAEPSFYQTIRRTRSASASIIEKRTLVRSSLLQPHSTTSHGQGKENKVLGRGSASSLRRPLRLGATTEAAQVSPLIATTSTSSQPYDVLNKLNGIGSYEPLSFEKDVYQWWENSGCFLPDAKHERRVGEKPYVLPMPPPNVTGRLHMGHAIFVALQDILARFHRMRGRPVLWLPGTDHAGIATQLQVEKQLITEGTTREEVGREEFLRRVWEYKEEQGGHITRQLRSLGASADWSRERFTMDQELSESVVEAFVQLHEKGLVYRGEYMVNWAPQLKTAVSDLEVEYSEEEGKLFFFKYMVQDSDGE